MVEIPFGLQRRNWWRAHTLSPPQQPVHLIITRISLSLFQDFISKILHNRQQNSIKILIDFSRFIVIICIIFIVTMTFMDCVAICFTLFLVTSLAVQLRIRFLNTATNMCNCTIRFYKRTNLANFNLLKLSKMYHDFYSIPVCEPICNATYILLNQQIVSRI